TCTLSLHDALPIYRTNAHLAIALDQTADESCPRYRRPLSQIQVRTNSESRRLSHACNRILERAPIRHQARAGDDATAMRLDDPLIDLLGETEIISRDNQFLHSLRPVR